MRHVPLPQIVRVAILLPPAVRMGSAGVLIDSFEMTRAYIRRQYGAIDILPRTDRFDVAELSLLSFDGKPARTEGGLVLPVSLGLDSRDYHLVVMADHAPQANGADADEDKSDNYDEAELARWLTRQARAGAILAASGHSISLLAQSGLLAQRKVATRQAMAGDWQRRWPDVDFDTERKIAQDGPVFTSRGGVADLDLARALVTAVTSQNSGRWLAAQLMIEMPAVAGPKVSDNLVEQAQNWFAVRFSQPVTIDDLARDLGVHRRTLHRHFKDVLGLSPIAYLQTVRIDASKRMLERTPFAVERIATLIGYKDVSFFRTLFKRATGMAPRQWRDRSRSAEPTER